MLVFFFSFTDTEPTAHGGHGSGTLVARDGVVDGQQQQRQRSGQQPWKRVVGADDEQQTQPRPRTGSSGR